MKLKSIFSLFLFSSIIVLSSCSIEKRVYRKGYNVVWNHNRADDSKRKEVIKTIKPLEEEIPTEVVVSADKEIIPLKSKPTLLLKDTCGDKLLLQNAEELIVRVMEVDDQFIKYKRCDNLDGPLYSISKNKVAVITYANGVKEVIVNEEPVKPKEEFKEATPKKNNPKGFISLLSYIASAILLRNITATATTGIGGIAVAGVLLAIASLVLAYVSLFEFRNQPGVYKGKWMPIAVIGLFVLRLLSLALSLVFNNSINGGGIGFAPVFLLIALVLIGLLIFALTRKKQPSTQTNFPAK